MRRLYSHSRKNRISKVFREAARSAHTVALLRFLSDPQLRAHTTRLGTYATDEFQPGPEADFDTAA